MDSFQTLKRRTTDLVGSLPSNAPSMPNVQLPAMPAMPNMSNIHMPAMPSFSGIGGAGGHHLKGTWQHVPLPPLPRSSHSIDVIDGSAYIFGGELEPRMPVDNDMHVVRLPSSGAPADYYTVKARSNTKPETIPELDEAATATTTTTTTPAIKTPEDDEEEEDEEEESEEEESEEEESEEEDSEEEDSDDESKAKLEDVSLASPPPAGAAAAAAASSASKTSAADKGKGKETATTIAAAAGVPCSRVGHATAVIGSRIFLFGGRNSDSQTLEEKGRVWVFSTRSNMWSHLDPHSSSPIPPARSYFAAVASDQPRDFARTLKPLRKRSQSWKQWAEGDSAEMGIPQAPIVGHVAENSIDEEDDGYGTFIIHGGCLADGGRTNDVWAFDVHSATWKELPAAPGPARGGPALAMVRNRLYRFGGYDGEGQQGGQLDVLELILDNGVGAAVAAEIGPTIRPGGGWQSTIFPSITRTTTNDAGESTAVTTATSDFPGNRSVACMNLVLGAAGREYLILMLGERDASSLGHAGAGKFWSDAWAFQVPRATGEGAVESLTSKFWSLTSRLSGKDHTSAVGGHARTGSAGEHPAALSDGVWTQLVMGPYDEDEPADARGPGPRGWLDSASLGDLEESGVVVFGGLSENNTRLGDLWIFRLE
ncbi:hypothetical protein Micbo1qcDRAFT_163762 [Microdochium bolleyi]|uniref:Kelch domain-containing protein n=1 Tax=Microdochium bolleyi TaxID=196109 RepID=A0A136J1X1_9PEZI|nr:hypothetical protein Micbo1qcDRAFT_163762 [Microdochium bolleyi]